MPKPRHHEESRFFDWIDDASHFDVGYYVAKPEVAAELDRLNVLLILSGEDRYVRVGGSPNLHGQGFSTRQLYFAKPYRVIYYLTLGGLRRGVQRYLDQKALIIE